MNQQSERISYLPTEGISYDPEEARYWDPAALEKELVRAFEICHGCRMCFKYCDSFPKLFRYVDEVHEGDVRKLSETERQDVVDSCFQCKLCEVQCPYTPRDGHEFQLDFPKLIHRYKAQKHERHGATFREKVLGDPDVTASVARMSLGLANTMNRVKAHRWFMEKALGIHRDKLLPDFASVPFDKWAAKEGHVATSTNNEAVLFQTCYVQHNEPNIGRDTVEVFHRNGVGLKCVSGLVCCGMPAWEHGDLESLRKQANNNLDKLMPHVNAKAAVVVLNPTCAMMMRREYPELLAGHDRERAKELAGAIRDPGEFLWNIRNEERFQATVLSKPNKPVSYHAPCHLRAQAVGFKSRDLMRKLFGENPKTTMECCGHDGTFAMTVEGFEPSAAIGKRAFDGMTEAGAEVWATDCPLAALQFQQHAGKKPKHPMSILAQAYRGEPFGDGGK